jgi:hypothetical protein
MLRVNIPSHIRVLSSVRTELTIEMMIMMMMVMIIIIYMGLMGMMIDGDGHDDSNDVDD